MNVLAKRLLTVILSLLLIGYVAYQAYSALYNPLRTDRAMSGTYYDKITTDCVVLHDEKLITGSADGVIDIIRDDGECVGTGEEIAAVYNTEKDAENSRKIKTLKDEIEVYKSMGNSDTVSSIDIAVLNSGISTSFLSLCNAAGENDITAIKSTKKDMLSLLNKKQLVTGQVTDFEKQISDLTAKLNALSASAGRQAGSIKSPAAGYYVSKTDGYEGAYDFKNVTSITSSEVSKLLNLNASSDKNTVGKILTNYQTYIVCNISKDESYRIHQGDTVKLHFLYSSQPELSVKLVSINKDAKGISAVFKSTTMSSSLAAIRKQKADIVIDSYKGIRVNNSYIHIVNGEKGVFVRSGNLINFKKITPIFSGQGYTVSSLKEQESGCLQLYDEIITNGDDLYDGKTIK